MEDPVTGEEALFIDEEAIDEHAAEMFRVQANRLSVCLSVRWGAFRGLLLADAEPDVLQEAYEKDPQWFHDVSFVKVAHHGGLGANPKFQDGLTLFEYLRKHRPEGKPLINSPASQSRLCKALAGWMPGPLEAGGTPAVPAETGGLLPR